VPVAIVEFDLDLQRPAIMRFGLCPLALVLRKNAQFVIGRRPDLVAFGVDRHRLAEVCLRLLPLALFARDPTQLVIKGGLAEVAAEFGVDLEPFAVVRFGLRPLALLLSAQT
jgi:hypothetical protein